MYIIYKATNKNTNLVYIGETGGELQHRISEHYREARYVASCHPEQLCKFHKELLNTKKDDWIWTIEDSCEDQKTNFQKEIYYIAKYNSYRHGYNSTEGGDNPPIVLGEKNCQARLTDQEADEIKQLLKTTLMQEKDIAAKYGVSVSAIERIQSGAIRFDPNEKYPLRQFNRYEIIALSIIEDLKNTKLKQIDIAKKYNVNSSFVCRVNRGKIYSQLYNDTFPIRK